MDRKILTALNELGFKERQFDKDVYILQYEGIKLVYKVYPDDDKFMQFGIPLDTYGRSDEELYAMANTLNIRLKYIKACVFQGNMWLTYEREIQANENIEQLMKNVVMCLMNSMHFYIGLMEGSVEKNDEIN